MLINRRLAFISMGWPHVSVQLSRCSVVVLPSWHVHEQHCVSRLNAAMFGCNCPLGAIAHWVQLPIGCNCPFTLLPTEAAEGGQRTRRRMG